MSISVGKKQEAIKTCSGLILELEIKENEVHLWADWPSISWKVQEGRGAILGPPISQAEEAGLEGQSSHLCTPQPPPSLSTSLGPVRKACLCSFTDTGKYWGLNASPPKMYVGLQPLDVMELWEVIRF